MRDRGEKRAICSPAAFTSIPRRRERALSEEKRTVDDLAEIAVILDANLISVVPAKTRSVRIIYEVVVALTLPQHFCHENSTAITSRKLRRLFARRTRGILDLDDDRRIFPVVSSK